MKRRSLAQRHTLASLLILVHFKSQIKQKIHCSNSALALTWRNSTANRREQSACGRPMQFFFVFFCVARVERLRERERERMARAFFLLFLPRGAPPSTYAAAIMRGEAGKFERLEKRCSRLAAAACCWLFVFALLLPLLQSRALLPSLGHDGLGRRRDDVDHNGSEHEKEHADQSHEAC